MATTPHSNQSQSTPHRHQVVLSAQVHNSIFSIAVSIGEINVRWPPKLTVVAGVVSALLWLLPGDAKAVNKCTGTDGAVVFQDAPCSGRGESLVVKPASGVQSDSTSKAADDYVERLNTNTAESRRQRLMRELQTLRIPGANQRLARHKAACAQEQRNLDAQQYRYVQNLYGKTHAAQIASEKAAAETRCANRQRELEADISGLQKELAELEKQGGKE